MTTRFLDLDTLVREWAEREYDEDANFWQRRLKRRNKGGNLGVHIDWSRTSFIDRTIEFPVMSDNKPKAKPAKANGSSASAAPPVPVAPGATKVTSGLDKTKPTMSLLFKTRYRNETNQPQHYTLRTEKKTKSAFSVTTEKSFTRGMEMSISLKTPGEIVEANAGYKREYTLTRTAGHEFEEEMTWGVESIINVDQERTAKAMLVVFEEQKAGNFKVETDISGHVAVVFTNRRDNNSLVMSPSRDISVIMKSHMARKDVNIGDFVKVNGKVVTVTTTGQCAFQYGVRQKVLVEQITLEEDNDEESEEEDE